MCASIPSMSMMPSPEPVEATMHHTASVQGISGTPIRNDKRLAFYVGAALGAVLALGVSIVGIRACRRRKLSDKQDVEVSPL